MSFINIGVYLRTSDAAIIITKFDYKIFSFGVSYDINFSKLRVASHLMGGLEISIICKINKLRSKISKKNICPVF